MEINNAFITFIKYGNSFLNYRLDQDAEELDNSGFIKYGKKEYGYYENDFGLRIGYLNGLIDEISLIFYNQDNLNIDILLEDDIICINQNTQIHEFIRLLNNQNILWKSNDEKNINVFSIKTEENVYILFDLENGCLTKIGINR